MAMGCTEDCDERELMAGTFWLGGEACDREGDRLFKGDEENTLGATIRLDEVVIEVEGCDGTELGPASDGFCVETDVLKTDLTFCPKTGPPNTLELPKALGVVVKFENADLTMGGFVGRGSVGCGVAEDGTPKVETGG